MSEEHGTKICPFCAEEIKTEAIKCRYCGSNLTESGTTGAQTGANGKEPVPSLPSFSSIQEGAVLSAKYKIIRLIGKGGMGVVYEAQEVDFDVDRSVAIKILTPTYIQDDKSLRRFNYEIKIAARLEHPNIVPIYNFGQEGSLIYFVMKYLSGPTLKAKIREQGVLSTAEIINIGANISDALAYMHEQGCIHRDIKSNNIMMDATGHPVLMDFGISKMAGGELLTTEGEILGTATYMAPEQWNGQIDARSDIYSFGCVLYEMATGTPPFVSDNIPELMRMHLDSPVPEIEMIRSDLPGNLIQAIYTCLAKKPDDRFQTMHELTDALRADNGPRKARAEAMEVTQSYDLEGLQSELVNPEDAIAEASELQAQGKIDKAIQCLEDAQLKGPDSAAIEDKLQALLDLQAQVTDLLSVVEARMLKKEHARAREEMEDFLEMVPSERVRNRLAEIDDFLAETESLFRKAMELQEKNRLAKAKEYHTKVVERDPLHTGASLALRDLREVPIATAGRSKLPIIIGVSLLAVALILVLVVFPFIFGDAYGQVYLNTADTLAEWGWYRFPPMINAISMYQKAMGTANSSKIKWQANAHWNDTYDTVIYRAQYWRTKGEKGRALGYYKVALKMAKESGRYTGNIEAHIKQLEK